MVDFIDMKNQDNKKLIYKTMRDEMEDDLEGGVNWW